MSFISPVWFRVELSQAAVIDFIGRTPPENYYMVPAGGNVYYGMVISDDVVEYLTNEFIVQNLEILSEGEVKKVLVRPGCRIWGSKELTKF